MTRMHRLMAVAGLGFAMLSQSGCATMYHRNNGLRIKQQQADGRTIRVLAMNLDHATPDLQVFEGDQRLPIVEVRDHIFSNAVNSSINESVARNSCRSAPGTVCEYTWTARQDYGPGLFLDPSREHTLRLVRGGQEATVTVKTRFKVKWYFYDMLLFPLAPVGWVVDGMTGSWNQYPRLDIDRAFSSGRVALNGGGE